MQSSTEQNHKRKPHSFISKRAVSIPKSRRLRAAPEERPAAAARASTPRSTPARTAPEWRATVARASIPKSTRSRTAPESHAAAAAGAPRPRRLPPCQTMKICSGRSSSVSRLSHPLSRAYPPSASTSEASSPTPRFLRRFRAHHRKPPLLGVFQLFQYSGHCCGRTLKRSFKLRSILKPPDRIHLHAIETSIHSAIQLIGCRHGRVLLMGGAHKKVSVCDPITGEAHHVPTPPEFRRYFYLDVAVLCTAADQGHVHGSCNSSPYKLVLMSPCREDDPPVACVYSSETGVWGNWITATSRCGIGAANPGILVGNVLYWSWKSASNGKPFLDFDVLTDDIIEFDLDRQSLAVIKGPPDLNASLVHQIIQTEEGAVGLVVISQGSFKMWERKVNCHGGATWLLQKTVEMHTILGLSAWIERPMGILGYDEENGVIFLYVDPNVYMVLLMSMQSRKTYESAYANSCHPFTSFYAPGIVGRCDGAEVLRPV